MKTGRGFGREGAFVPAEECLLSSHAAPSFGPKPPHPTCPSSPPATVSGVRKRPALRSPDPTSSTFSQSVFSAFLRLPDCCFILPLSSQRSQKERIKPAFKRATVKVRVYAGVCVSVLRSEPLFPFYFSSACSHFKVAAATTMTPPCARPTLSDPPRWLSKLRVPPLRRKPPPPARRQGWLCLCRAR